jgi:cytochrome c oxidase subunit 1
MAIIERPAPGTTVPALAPAAPAITPARTFGALRRPVTSTGWKSWLFTVDHKKLGIMYGAMALFFFIVGGLEAVLIRLQLAAPDGKVLNADLYNQMFTMHATTMVFLFVMPMAAAFANYFIPLQIGARDVAFPRLNAFGFWCVLGGGIVVNLAWFLGGAADGGWFMYAPNSGPVFSPSHGVDFWALGLQIAGIASLTGAINLIVTVLNMRAPGMTLMKMPIFTWMITVVQFLLLFAIPVITVALFLLSFQRMFGAQFFDVAAGADPLLWQHLFWIFGHPEVYVLILPSFGIISEVLPVFSRKPLFGYPFVVFSGAAIGFVGWGVWAHHMFASGLGPVSVAVFSVATMAIAVPTGVKIINWTLTMWGGKLVFTTAMKFAIGLVVLFTIGGLSGVTHSVAPSDTQQTDTYYIVAHFHYVLFGGAIFGLFSGFYYWWPKMFGKMLNERLGSWNFWLMVIGMNLTFGPMHILGLQGQPRRMYVHRRNGTQQRARSARPVERTQPRVDDIEPTEGAQLRLDSPRAPPRRVLPPQVRRRPHYSHDARSGDGRAGSRRARAQCRQAHPHAFAVVLADRACDRPADHRARFDLLHPRRHRRRTRRLVRDLRLGTRAFGCAGERLRPGVRKRRVGQRSRSRGEPWLRLQSRTTPTARARGSPTSSSACGCSSVRNACYSEA